MNSRAAVFVLLFGFLIALAVVPPIADALTPEPTGMSIQFYDSDGNLVYTTEPEVGLFGFAFQLESGVEVASLTVTVNYVIEGLEAGSTWSLTVNTDFVIRENTQYGDLSHSNSWSDVLTSQAYATSGSLVSDKIVLADVIILNQESEAAGWIVEVDVDLDLTETIGNSQDRFATATYSDSAILSWSVDSVLSVSGGVSLG